MDTYRGVSIRQVAMKPIDISKGEPRIAEFGKESKKGGATSKALLKSKERDSVCP
jgi:hypothetical protein